MPGEREENATVLGQITDAFGSIGVRRNWTPIRVNPTSIMFLRGGSP